MNSPLNYLGGKSRLAKRIIPLIPKDHLCYCEPFCGAAWVFFGKEQSRAEVLNDMDGELVCFWRVIQNHLEEFLRYFKFAIVSRKLFEIEQQKDPALLTDIQRAVRYYYLQKAAFGGKTHKRTFGTSAESPPRLNITNIEERLLEVHWRLAQVTVEHLGACRCIEKYDRKTTFFYVDPPYWKTAGYRTPFVEEDFIRLRDTLKKIKGRFLMSMNDAAPIRTMFKAFKIRKVSTVYSVGNTRTAPKTQSVSRGEILIRNY